MQFTPNEDPHRPGVRAQVASLLHGLRVRDVALYARRVRDRNRVHRRKAFSYWCNIL
jgi:hypothetical protein